MGAGNALAPVFTTDHGDDDLYVSRVTRKRDTRSKLIRSKEKYPGHIINACPFGCKDEDLDAEMYCKHLVGFTDHRCETDETSPAFDREEIIWYPMEFRPEIGKDENGKTVSRPGTRYRFVNGQKPLGLEDGDRLVVISTSCRVYRNVDKNPKKAKE